ncbi:hypothetical protein GOV05_01365 [Candidatus Woesearchaeota archaeon]|nr:hypothetical protein [Candidatus Woesearchaeota archaeon]
MKERPINYDRIFEIPQKGESEKYVLEQVRLSAKDTLADYSTGHPSTKPGTNPDPLSQRARNIGEDLSNPNLIDQGMFRGAYNREKEAVSMTARMFGKEADDSNLDAGFLLSGGTESLNQALWMIRNKFFSQSYNDAYDADIRTDGLLGLAKKIVEKEGKIPNPRILSPVNYHFSINKGVDLAGLGVNSIAYYDLDKNFDVDEASLENTIREIYDDGDNILVNLAVAGDTPRGKVHDVNLITKKIREVSTELGKDVPPTFVDAAGAYLFIATMQDNSAYDGVLPNISFENKDIEGIIGDPHKQEMPYSCGMLLLKDWDLLKYTDTENFSSYLDVLVDNEQKKAGLHATAMIPTSRSGANAFAVWAYHVNQGLEGIRSKKENIWGLVKEFANYVDTSPHYDLVSEPQTQVVSFRLKDSNPNNHKSIYETIKHDPSDFLHISHDTGLLVRTKEELGQTRQKTYKKDMIYSGLFTTFTEHNNGGTIGLLTKRLDKEAKRLR